MTDAYREWKKRKRRALFEALRDDSLNFDALIDLYFSVHWGKHNPAIEESFRWFVAAASEVTEARVRLERREYLPSQRRVLETIATTRV